MSAPNQANGSAQEAPRAADPEHYRYRGLQPGSYTDLKLVSQLHPHNHGIRPSLMNISMNSAMPPLIICI